MKDRNKDIPKTKTTSATHNKIKGQCENRSNYIQTYFTVDIYAFVAE